MLLYSLTFQNSVIQNDSSEFLAPTPPQELFGRVLIDLGQNHSKASANNLAIYMTD